MGSKKVFKLEGVRISQVFRYTCSTVLVDNMARSRSRSRQRKERQGDQQKQYRSESGARGRTEHVSRRDLAMKKRIPKKVVRDRSPICQDRPIVVTVKSKDVPKAMDSSQSKANASCSVRDIVIGVTKNKAKDEFECVLCTQIFTRKYNLQRHVRQVHTLDDLEEPKKRFFPTEPNLGEEYDPVPTVESENDTRVVKMSPTKATKDKMAKTVMSASRNEGAVGNPERESSWEDEELGKRYAQSKIMSISSALANIPKSPKQSGSSPNPAPAESDDDEQSDTDSTSSEEEEHKPAEKGASNKPGPSHKVPVDTQTRGTQTMVPADTPPVYIHIENVYLNTS